MPTTKKNLYYFHFVDIWDLSKVYSPRLKPNTMPKQHKIAGNDVLRPNLKYVKLTLKTVVKDLPTK